MKCHEVIRECRKIAVGTNKETLSDVYKNLVKFVNENWEDCQLYSEPQIILRTTDPNYLQFYRMSYNLMWGYYKSSLIKFENEDHTYELILEYKCPASGGLMFSD